MNEPSNGHEHFVTRYGKYVLRSVNGLISRYSVHPEATFYNQSLFPWVPEVETRWADMRAELDELLRDRESIPPFHEVSADQYGMSSDNRWRTYFLYGYGHKVENNCAKCPKTVAALEKIPGMTTAIFSILSGKKHIPPHNGPYKGVLRYHLGLKVPGPPGACRIQVGGDTRAWEERRSLIFDDSYEHQAWNDTDEERAVLFVDFIRPMRFPGTLLNAAFFAAIRMSPFVTHARRNIVRWERRLATKP